MEPAVESIVPAGLIRLSTRRPTIWAKLEIDYDQKIKYL
jgi:hypothetical protein